MEKEQVAIKDKVTLTVKEAAMLSNIGEHKVRAMAKEPNCTFSLMSGKNILIKRRKFEEYLEKASVV